MLCGTNGSSKLGCLVAVLIVGLVIYAGYHWGTAQWNYVTIKEGVWNAAKFAAATKNINYAALKQTIINKADQAGVALYEDDIEIAESQLSITIDVYWDTPIAFPGYTYYLEHHVSRTEQKTY